MEFNELIQKRRSVRAYQSKPVNHSTLVELMDAVRLAPTWKNSQTGRYYIVETPEQVNAIRACLPAFNQKSSNNAAVLIVSTFITNVAGHTDGVADNEPGNQWGAYDLGLQNAYLVLKATDLGLDTLIMGLRDAEKLRELLSIPQEEQIMAVISVGYRDGEPVFRPRKELSDICRFI